MSSEELTGRTLGDFVVRHKIGEGGFGAVYRAEQPVLGREAVIKVLQTRHLQSKTVIQRFLREARLASKLDHPYAAHIYAFGVETDDLMWIAMEYVRGMSLHELLRTRGPMALEELVPLLDRICEVLQAAHELGIVHRDIKPPNVMVVQRSGRAFPKLLDFGIAKLADDEPGRPAAITTLPTAVTIRAPETLPSANTVSFSGPVGGPVAARLEAIANRPRLESEPTVEVATPTGEQAVLTEAGAAVGSPPYMAPEQWDDAKTVTTRTDLYALGVMTYEALVGRRPFSGNSMMAMALAHGINAVPPLGGTLPIALDAVMKKALAKQPQDRYDNALAFAQAFRAAAGFGGQPLPALDDDLRISIETSFPQPLAEAVAAFHASRNPHQARDALHSIASTSLRYLALTALAAQAQVRLTEAGSAARIAELIRELRRRPLRDEEWLKLARQLVAPFALQPKTHAMPELVALLSSEGESDLLTTLAQPRSDAPDALHTVHEQLPVITRVLRALAFLADYPLVVVAEGHAESWMGVRRPRRVALEIHGRTIEPAKPTLVDANSRPLIELWPVIQASSPMPGAAAELFMLDGRGRRGARLVAMPQTLERQDEQVWEWLAERFADHDRDTPPATITDEPRPYRGLSSFTSQDADTFVGREREIDAAVNRLKVSSIVAVVGPSGAGKSSFVHAGIVPSLPAGWTAISLRPGATPLATLEARLRRVNLDREATTVLVVDQFEELFTLGASVDDQRAFVRALLCTGDDNVRIVITLRDDFLARATQLPELRERLPPSLFLLATPGRPELVRILSEPLARLGFDFDDPKLARQMVEQVAETPGALALLSFTAQKLWELRDRHFRQLTRKAYDALGGVAGALAQHAEATLAELSANEQRLARTALGHLVTAEGTRAILSRNELDQLLRDPHAATVIEKLVAARLLTATESEGGDETIEIVHEALISAWPRLAEWRREDAEGARLRDQVRAAARQWIERDKPRGLLWRDDALAELSLWRARHPQPLTDADEAFVKASLAEAVRGRRWRRGIIGVVIGLMSIAVAVLIWARSNAQSAAAHDRARSQHELVEGCRQAILAGHAAEARTLLAEARALGAEETPLLRFLEVAANAPLQTTVATLSGHTKEVRRVEFDRSGTRVLSASSDGTARLWDAKTGAQLATLGGCKTSSSGARFDPMGRRIATECDDGMVRIYSATGALEHEVSAGTERWVSLYARFSPDGSRLVTTFGKQMHVWDAASGALAWSAPEDSRATRPVFADNGTSIITYNNDSLVVWSAATGQRIRTMSLGSGTERDPEPAMIFDAKTSEVVLVAGTTAEIWDTKTGALVHTLVGHSAPIDRLAIRRDGGLVATGSRDNTVRLWRLSDGALVFSLSTGIGVATDVAFSPDGRTLGVATTDGAVLIWDVATGTQLLALRDHSGTVWTLDFSPSSDRVATGGADTQVVVSRLAATATRVLEHGGEVVQLQTRGHVILAIDSAANLWDTISGQLLACSAADDITAGGFSGDQVIVGHRTGVISIWDRGSERSIAKLAGPVDRMVVRDGHVAATAGREITIVDIASGAVRRGETPAAPTVIELAPDGTAYTGDYDGHVTIFAPDGSSRAISHPYGLISAIAVSKDVVVTSGGDGTLRRWSPEGRLLRVFTGHAADVYDVKLDHASRRLVSVSIDGTARLWDLQNGMELAKMVHSSWVIDAIFTPGDRFVFTASHDGEVRLWDASTGLELQRFAAQGTTGGERSLAIDPDQHLLIVRGGRKLVLHHIDGLDWD